MSEDELPAESPLAAASLHDGWCVVLFDHHERARVDDAVLTRISRACELVVAGAEEHVMQSFSAGWRDGERVWRSRHDAALGIDHLEAEGSLPQGFDDVRRRRLGEQERAGGADADVDHVFDVPLAAARLATGFSHDESEPPDGFAVLAPAG